jgi:secreted trypsin-like serine protease
MKHLWGLVLLSACTAQLDAVGADSAMAKSAIVNGTPDTSHDAVVALIGLDSLTHPMRGETCSATIVAIDAGQAQVLTAAHCFEKLDAGWAFLAVVGTDYSTVFDAGVAVRDVTLHPFFAHGPSGSLFDDFAMFRLDAPAGVAPIPALTPQLDDLQTGSMVTLVGFGFTDMSADVNTTRMKVTRPISQLDDLHIAIDQSHGAGGQCQGDSGGPALYTSGGREYVAGVISYGDLSCASIGISARVSRAFDGFVSQYVQGRAPSMQRSCGDCQATAVAGACAAAYGACSNNADCVALATCENGCGDAACVTACEAASPAGVSLLAAVNDCLCGPVCATECSAECSPPPVDGGIPDAGTQVVDAGTDAGAPPDAGAAPPPDAGSQPQPQMMAPRQTCGCTSAGSGLIILAALVHPRRSAPFRPRAHRLHHRP